MKHPSKRDDAAEERVLLFHSIHQVLAAEKRLEAEGLWHDVVPVPRDLSSDCGMAVRIRADQLEDVLDRLESLSEKPRGLYAPDGRAHRDLTAEHPGRFDPE